MKLLKGVKVLITGGDGFIGSHLTRRLIKEESKIVLIIHPGASLWRIRDLTALVKIIKVDIADYRSLRSAIFREKPRKIFHLAACLSKERSLKASDIAVKVNLQGTINLLRALEKVKYDCFLNTGTSEEYGKGPLPAKEDQPVSPVSPYSASKSAVSLFCDMYYKTQGCPIVTLRPSTVYGPAQGLTMFIPQLIVSALQKKDFKMTKGKQTRDFVYVSDVVEGYIKASLSLKAIGQIINLSAGIERSLREIAKKIVTATGNSIKIIPGALLPKSNEIPRLYCDNTKAQKLLMWKPKVNIEQGLKETIDWYSKNINFFQ